MRRLTSEEVREAVGLMPSDPADPHFWKLRCGSTLKGGVYRVWAVWECKGCDTFINIEAIFTEGTDAALKSIAEEMGRLRELAHPRCSELRAVSSVLSG